MWAYSFGRTIFCFANEGILISNKRDITKIFRNFVFIYNIEEDFLNLCVLFPCYGRTDRTTLRSNESRTHPA